jgi:uncharacterized membrane protein YdjX (TVP38/TMEM64 family)
LDFFPDKHTLKHLVLPLLLCGLTACLAIRLLDAMPSLYQSLITAGALILASLKMLVWVKKWPRTSKVINYLIYYLTGAFLALILIHSVTRLMMLTDYYGFEYILQQNMGHALSLFFLICFLQPIALPVPEPVTVMAGSAVLGSFNAFVISYLGTVLGIITMYLLAKMGGDRLKAMKGHSKGLERYNHYLDRYGHWVIAVLLIFPVLPDEIICLGAGFSGMLARRFIPLVLASKLVTAYVLSYLPGIF